MTSTRVIVCLLAAILAAGALALAAKPLGAQQTLRRELQIMEEIRPLINGARDSARDAQAAALFLSISPQRLRSPDLAFDAATVLATSGHTPLALQFLRRAVALGYRTDFTAVPQLATLREEPRWPETVRAQIRARQRFERARATPDAARISVADVHRFWRAYDRAATLPPEQQTGVFRRDYFDAGSSGLLDFFYYRIPSEETFARAVLDHARYFASIRAATLSVPAHEPALRQAYARLEALYPQTVFPDLYLLVGGLTAGGTVSPAGLLISVDLSAVDEKAVTDELPPTLRGAPRPASEIVPLVIHELVHYQQTLDQDDRSLLRAALEEGGADFVTELITGTTANEPVRRYGDRHERELWERFRADLHTTDWSDWIASRDKATGDAPPDLGYYVGYRIVRAFYERAADKREAVRQIITIRDAFAFLEASGYDGRSTAAP